MSTARSLFDSILVKFSMIMLSVVLTFAFGQILDNMMFAFESVSILHDIPMKWAETDRSQTMISVIYIMCWVPAVVAILQPILAGTRKAEVETVQAMGDQAQYAEYEEL